MNPTAYPFQDFRRAKQQLRRALLEHHEPFVLLTGDTGTGKTALLRELRADIDRARYRLVYFAQASKLGAPAPSCCGSTRPTSCPRRP